MSDSRHLLCTHSTLELFLWRVVIELQGKLRVSRDVDAQDLGIQIDSGSDASHLVVPFLAERASGGAVDHHPFAVVSQAALTDRP